ncbi:HEC/Ndc80p family-domain-containing protein [Lipomyces oligophaga]|uniref:HEC/Ndc80p family-domain-containing protein n=1 Tax=Lipomyces oligophaga TaxID=45792 RepID=UPI0034CDB2DD
MSQERPLTFSGFRRSTRENMTQENVTAGTVPMNMVLPRSSLPMHRASLALGNSGILGNGSMTGPKSGASRQSMVPMRSSFSRQSLASGAELANVLSLSNPNVLNIPGSAKTPARRSIVPGLQNASQLNLYGSQSQNSAHARKNSASMGGSGNGRLGGAGGGFLAAVMAAPATRDSRIIRDRGFQNRIANVVYEYLVNNNFELEMKHSITPKSLKSPTQKDFVMMFQWLCRRLDPGYRFTKSIENEVIPVLKGLGYPYMETISKSQLVAVGGQNWGAYLAMLNWLVELSEGFDAEEQGDYDIEQPEDVGLSQIVVDYQTKAYAAYLQTVDDYSEYEAELREAFEERDAAIQETANQYTEQREKIEEEIEELKRTMPSLEAIIKKTEMLKNDLTHFQEYIEGQEKKKVKRAQMLQSIKEEITSMTAEHNHFTQEKKEIESKISEQGMTPTDIDQIVMQGEQLSRARQANETRLDELSRKFQERQLKVQQAADSLDALVRSYNTRGYRIGILPAGAVNGPSDKNFEIKLADILADENLGARPRELLNGIDLCHEVTPALQKARMNISAKINKCQEESIKLETLLDRVADVLVDKREQADVLEAQIARVKVTYDEAFETMSSEASSSNAEYERLESKIAALKIGVEDGKLELSQRAERAEIEWDQMQRDAELVREDMQRQINSSIERIVNFKLHIQKGLEEHENFVVDELDAWHKTQSERQAQSEQDV